MNDNELFELCKEVYKRFPEWNDTLEFYSSMGVDDIHANGEYEDYGSSYRFHKLYDIPLYTSDYLLDKLPSHIYDGYYLSMVKDQFDGPGYYVGYFAYGEPEHFYQRADTPLKALLKLVIALDDAGVKFA